MAIDPVIEPEFVFSDRFSSRTLVYQTITRASALARDGQPVKLDESYGGHERESLDIFPGDAGRPLLVFIHGGYWRSQHKGDYSFVATELGRHGISVAVLGYPLAPAWPLARIASSLRQAMAWLAGPGQKHLPRIGEVVVAGHSAGAQLAAMLASDSDGYVPISGCLAISGIYDVRPLVRTSIGISIGLDDALAHRSSPILTPPGRGWLITAVGANETATFRKQAASYAAHWSAAGSPVTSLLVHDADHYSILLQLADHESPVLRALLTRLNLADARSEVAE